MSEREGWVATARLRFVERVIQVPEQRGPVNMIEAHTKTLRILQQWFAPDVPRYMIGSEGEWRDVGVDKEISP